MSRQGLVVKKGGVGKGVVKAVAVIVGAGFRIWICRGGGTRVKSWWWRGWHLKKVIFFWFSYFGGGCCCRRRQKVRWIGVM